MSTGYEEYLSHANKVDTNCKSILRANVQARMIEQDACASGGFPFAMDPQVWVTRHRYTREFCLPGQANRTPSRNNIY
jgi:hypothetical protein